MGKIILIGDVSGKRYEIYESASGVIIVKNVTDNVVPLIADSTTIRDAGNIALNSHASRHAYGGADALGEGSIDRTQLRPLGFHIVKTANPTPGTGGSYGTPVDIDPAPNKSIILLYIKLVWGGTFGTDETVTIRVTVRFSDNTTASITKSATAPGTIWVEDASDLTALMKDGVYVNRVSIDSSSNLSSTTVTTSATIYGIEI